MLVDGLSLAHVRYVSDGSGAATRSGLAGVGSFVELLSEAMQDPIGLVAVLASLFALIVVGLVAANWPGWGSFRRSLAQALSGYVQHLPWVLRLSAGIMLMGAGLGGYWFAFHLDDLAVRGAVSLLLLASGFFLLLGLAVRLWALLGLAVFGVALALRGADVLMAAELAAALVALTAISAGRPSVDDLLAKTVHVLPGRLRGLRRLTPILGPGPEADVSAAMSTWVPFVLRIGLGLSLAYAGFVEKLLDPGPALVLVGELGLAVGPVSPAAVVLAMGLVEVFLGVCILIGLGTRTYAALSFVVLTITLFALPNDPVLGHVGLWGIATAVFILGSGPWSFDAVLQGAMHPRGSKRAPQSP